MGCRIQICADRLILNPDGTYGVLFASGCDKSLLVSVSDGHATATVQLPAHSVVSLRF